MHIPNITAYRKILELFSNFLSSKNGLKRVSDILKIHYCGIKVRLLSKSEEAKRYNLIQTKFISPES